MSCPVQQQDSKQRQSSTNKERRGWGGEVSVPVAPGPQLVLAAIPWEQITTEQEWCMQTYCWCGHTIIFSRLDKQTTSAVPSQHIAAQPTHDIPQDVIRQHAHSEPHHWLKGLEKVTPSPSASLMHKKFCAAAVSRMEEVLLPPCSCWEMRNACVFLSRLLMMGTNTPPARAVVDGIAGQMAHSAAWKQQQPPHLVSIGFFVNIDL